jgi:hypothetical protein
VIASRQILRRAHLRSFIGHFGIKLATGPGLSHCSASQSSITFRVLRLPVTRVLVIAVVVLCCTGTSNANNSDAFIRSMLQNRSTEEWLWDRYNTFSTSGILAPGTYRLTLSISTTASTSAVETFSVNQPGQFDFQSGSSMLASSLFVSGGINVYTDPEGARAQVTQELATQLSISSIGAQDSATASLQYAITQSLNRLSLNGLSSVEIHRVGSSPTGASGGSGITTLLDFTVASPTSYTFAQSAAIPEPSSTFLLVGGAVGGCFRMRRRSARGTAAVRPL